MPRRFPIGATIAWMLGLRSCSVVLVRAFYSWTPITPGLGDAMANMSNGAHLLQATAAIRNEPFSTSRPTC